MFLNAPKKRPACGKHITNNHRIRPLRHEQLEDRRLLAGITPNDPQFAEQWVLHNTGQTGGTVDADIDAPQAWAITTGSMETVVAMLDTGIDYTHPDLYLNIWLNEAEIPTDIANNLSDIDGDEIISCPWTPPKDGIGAVVASCKMGGRLHVDESRDCGTCPFCRQRTG